MGLFRYPFSDWRFWAARVSASGYNNKMSIHLEITGDGLLVPVRVTPKSSRNAIEPSSPDDEWVRIRVTAPPEDGKANQAVIRLLSKTLKLPKRDIEIVSGNTSRYKRLLLKTENPDRLKKTLTGLIQTGTS